MEDGVNISGRLIPMDEDDPLNASFASIATAGDTLQTLLQLEDVDDLDDNEVLELLQEDEDQIVGEIGEEIVEDEEGDEVGGEEEIHGPPPAPQPSTSALPREPFSSEILGLPLYPGSSLTLKRAILLILDFCNSAKVNEQGLQLLLQLVGEELLPKQSALPRTTYLLYQAIGLNTEDFARHICVNECFTFPPLHRSQWAENCEDACPKCKEPRFRYQGQSITPRKKFYYIPLRYHLRNLKAHPSFMQSLERMKEEITEGVSPLDSIWGAKLMEGFLERSGGLANFLSHFALSVGMDAVNCCKTSTYSVIPVASKIWNLHEHERTSLEFLMLNILIPGGKKPKRYDGYFQPFVEEMNALPGPGEEKLELVSTEQDHVMLCDTTEHLGVATTLNCTRCLLGAVPNPCTYTTNPQTVHEIHTSALHFLQGTHAGKYLLGHVSGEGFTARKKDNEFTRRVSLEVESGAIGERVIFHMFSCCRFLTPPFPSQPPVNSELGRQVFSPETFPTLTCAMESSLNFFTNSNT